MRILVLGAGGTGGYFGGRLAEAGADITFLVRPRRAATIAEHGLIVKSRCGDLQLPVQTVLQDTLKPSYDLILLSCKAYDLDSALSAITPAMAAHTVVLPLLNGLRHYQVLDKRYRPAQVLGGVCHIGATLNELGEVVHLNEVHNLFVGARTADQQRIIAALPPVFSAARFDFRVTDDIDRALWEKFVFLTTAAAMTTLMRGSIGDIVATDDGAALIRETLETCEATATAAGTQISDKWRQRMRDMLLAPGSALTASMLRDIERGGPTEADHIVGDMLMRAVAAGLPAATLRTAYCHLQSYDRRRTAATPTT